MASDAPLPILYKELVPLSTVEHAGWKAQPITNLSFLKGVHALPLTVEEMIDAQRHFPIVFSSGEQPIPLILMGLNEGINTFVDEDGRLNTDVYIPAYVRRYPYMLVKLRPESEDLSLCFDPTAGTLGADVDGFALFDDGKPSKETQDILGFCEQFEQSGQKSMQFVDELKSQGLLMEGEVAIQVEGQEQPFIYRGFQMIDETKLREVRGDVLRKWNQSGMLALIFAHLYSLQLMRVIFARQQAVIQNADAAAAALPATDETEA